MTLERLTKALELIDAVNSKDPNSEISDDHSYPKELLYSMRMTEWLNKLEPDAADEIKIAARAQHISRWSVPRDSYPKTRKGYLQWRTYLYQFHADKTSEIMQETGYNEESIAKVQKILKKRGLRSDPDVQLIEDIACLVFLENYFSEFSEEYEAEKIISIVQKTWKKMSDRAKSEALKLQFPEPQMALIKQALN